jgi:type IV secretory pathway VirB3-like protein
LVVVMVLICLECLFFVLQRLIKQTDQQLEEMQRTLSQTRLAPGTQPYCRQCRFYGANRYIVCALHPEGWSAAEAVRCVDWDTAASETPETR